MISEVANYVFDYSNVCLLESSDFWQLGALPLSLPSDLLPILNGWPLLLILGWEVTVARDTVFSVVNRCLCLVGVWLWAVSSWSNARVSSGLLCWKELTYSLPLGPPKHTMDGSRVCVLVLPRTASALTRRNIWPSQFSAVFRLCSVYPGDIC